MTRKRPGLGKGLDALIPQGSGFQPTQFSSGYKEIPIERVKPNPRQPRENFDASKLSELAESIREFGVIQPLIVSPGTVPEEFILIAGERRLKAAKEAGLYTVPVIVREADEQNKLELALIENIQRTDLSPLEKAEAYRQLNDEFNLNHEMIGKRVGKSRVTITNTLRLLSLPLSIQKAITENSISEGHARALLGLTTSQSQIGALKTILEQELTVRQTENLVRKLTGEKPVVKKKTETSPEIKALEESLRLKFGTKVNLKQKQNKGSITIYYYSDEELNSLMKFFLDEE